MHEGKLELMSWDWKHPELGTIGWGNTIPEDVRAHRIPPSNPVLPAPTITARHRLQPPAPAYLSAQVPLVRAQFENECRGKKSVFFKKRPHAFRWTCCGVEGSSNFGCDHHGTGRQPCMCDFCRSVGAPRVPSPRTGSC
jgi:hypothetical protein